MFVTAERDPLVGREDARRQTTSGGASVTVPSPALSTGRWYPKIKRAADVSAAAVGLLLASPVMLATAIAIRVSTGKPILFRQARPGLNEKSFICLKFRTMTDERDANGQLLSDNHRSTPLGTFLRRTSLDELPQLWNVLRGELSFVGPRPLLPQYLPYYTETEQRRHLVRPGLTGWAQIHQRSCLSFDKRLAMDAWYVDHMSWHLDLRIAFATVWIVMTQRGATPENGEALLPLDVQRSQSMPPANVPSDTKA
jgi:lipopolysaccharide/colanic/teichoic acid biosynthesis glycosyltransferase